MRNKYKISILCPAIRSDRWVKLYESVDEAFSGTWELVLITEKELPEELKGKKNIKVIFSKRAPLHKQQQGLCQANGEYITAMSDDSLWMPNSLNYAFDEVDKENYKSILILKYLEGENRRFPDWYLKEIPKFEYGHDFMRSDDYYRLYTHQGARLRHVPENSPLLSCAIYSKRLLYEVGGWDCIFQTQAIGNVDLSARLIKYGCKWNIHPHVTQKCGHMPGENGDHSAIHHAQLKDDQPLLEKIYDQTDTSRNKVFVPLHNWVNTWVVWPRDSYVRRYVP